MNVWTFYPILPPVKVSPGVRPEGPLQARVAKAMGLTVRSEQPT